MARSGTASTKSNRHDRPTAAAALRHHAGQPPVQIGDDRGAREPRGPGDAGTPAALRRLGGRRRGLAPDRQHHDRRPLPGARRQRRGGRRRRPGGAARLGRHRARAGQRAVGADQPSGAPVSAAGQPAPARAVAGPARPGRQFRPAARDDGGTDPRRRRPLRPHGRRAEEGRLRRRAGALRAWLPVVAVPVATHQPTRRRLGRHAGEPRAAAARIGARGAGRGGAGIPGEREAELVGLRQGRLRPGGVPAGRALAERGRHRPARGLGRHLRADRVLQVARRGRDPRQHPPPRGDVPEIRRRDQRGWRRCR